MSDLLSHVLDDVVVYAGLHPWYFIICSLLCLAPFFSASVYFSRQLAHDIDLKLADRRIRLKRLLESLEIDGDVVIAAAAADDTPSHKPA